MESRELNILLRVISMMRQECSTLMEPRLELFLTIAQNEPAQQQPVGTLLGMSEAATSRNVKELTKAGLVSVVRDDSDKRRRFLSLTPEGSRLVTRAASLLMVSR